MSGLPEMTGGVDLEELKEGYVDIWIKRDDFCSYRGECKIDMVSSNGQCLYCIYRIGLRIPQMIDAAIEQKRKKKEEEERKIKEEIEKWIKKKEEINE
jgi:hypothetical protein